MINVSIAATCPPEPVLAEMGAARARACQRDIEDIELEKVEMLRAQEDATRRPASCQMKCRCSTSNHPICIHSRASCRDVDGEAQATMARAEAVPRSSVQKPGYRPSPPQVRSPPQHPARPMSAKSPPTPNAIRDFPLGARSVTPEKSLPLCEDVSPPRSERGLQDLRFVTQRFPASPESDASVPLATEVCWPHGPYGEYPLPGARRPHRATPEASRGTHVTRPPHATGAAWYPMDLNFNPKLGIFLGNAAH